MKALVYTSDNNVILTEVAEPQMYSDHSVKVKIWGSGVCGTDLNIIKGKITATPETIIGHEGVGTVVAIGNAVTSLKVGDRVIIDPTQSCGRCPNCQRGLFCFCDDFDNLQVGLSTNGTFAEYYVGEDRFIYKIPESMTWERASLTEPLGCALNTALKANIKPFESVLVLGSGPIGLLCQMISMRICKLVVATELDSFRREFASHHIYYALHPDELTQQRVKQINNGRLFDVVIDAVGNQLNVAMKFVEKGGRVVPMGYDEAFEAEIKPTDLINNGTSIIAETRLHASLGYALQYAESFSELDSLITTKETLSDHRSAFGNLMGVDPLTKEKKAISSIKTILLS